MSFESLDIAYLRGVNNKFTYKVNLSKILLELCKRPNKVYLIKMLKTGLKQVLGENVCFMYSAFDI